jgi:hypothetical protein
MLGLLLAAAVAMAAPQSDWDRDRADAGALAVLAKGCDLDFDVGVTRGINYRHDIGRYLRAMLKDPPACPGLAQRAARFVIDSVGAPERADVDIEMLARARDLVRDRRLVRADRALDLRYSRILWLFEATQARADWPVAEWRRWAEGPEAIALLAARNDMARFRSERSLQLEADLRLRRDLPAYDPQRAVKLLGDPRLSGELAVAERIAALWSDGVHLPRDLRAAAMPFRYGATLDSRYGVGHRLGLLKIARLAAAAARTPANRALALNLLFGAALGGDAQVVAERDALLARLGRIPSVALAPDETERIGRAIDSDYGWALGTSGAEKPGRDRTIGLRALIGPDGRVAMVKVARSCGVAERDRRVVAIWFQYGPRIDLSATARGRFVWVDLPPIDPELTTWDAYQRWNK